MSPAKRLARIAGRIGTMMAPKKTTKKTTAKKKSTAKKTSAKKSTAKKSTAKKSTAKKSTAKKSSAKKSTAKKKSTTGRAGGRSSQAASKKKSAAKRSTAKKSTAKKTAAKKTTKKSTARKTSAEKKSTTGRAGGRSSQGPSKKKTSAKRSTDKKKSTTGRAGGRSSQDASKSESPVTRPPIKNIRPFKAPAAAKPVTRTVKPAKLDKAALKKIKEQLQTEKAELEGRLEELEAESSAVTDMAGDGGVGDDFADAGTATFDRERDLSIRNNVLDLIDQTSRALARLDEGSYGTCENCGNPIDAARIKAFPRASLCLDCKRREERSR